MSEEWKVVPGYYPGFLEIVGSSFKVSVVTDAIDLTLDDHIARVRDAHIMAAGKDLLAALIEAREMLEQNLPSIERNVGFCPNIVWKTVLASEIARSAIAKARGQV